jgi:hypothetical protein
VAALVLTAVIVSAVRYRSHRRALTRQGRERHRERSPQIELLDEQNRAVLERISWLARNEKVRSALMEDPLNSGREIKRLAARALDEGMVELREAARLLHALGMDARSLRNRPSSREALSPGTEVSVSDGRGRVVRGKIRETDDVRILIDVLEAAGHIDADVPVEVVGHRSAYLTTFESRTISSSGDSFAIETPQRLRLAQRRRYNRVPVRLRVDVRPHDPQKTRFGTRTFEMSAGGASIRNRKRILEAGEKVDCILRPERNPVGIHAEVTATSDKDRIAHLSFESVDATLKHRILRLLFKRRRAS